MKLQVGQKIGIYEALRNEGDQYNPYVIKSNQYVGEDLGLTIDLFDEEQDESCLAIMNHNEVRKVGSLIVKRLK